MAQFVPGPFSVPRRTLMGPGPLNIHPRVLRAMSTPITGYLDTAYFKVLDEVAEMLRHVYGTIARTMAVSGSGSAGMEAGLASLLEPGQKVIICSYGYFCERMVSMAERIGAEVIPVRSEWGRAMDPAALRSALDSHRDVSLVTAIQAETSTGVLQPVAELSKLAHANGALFMIDCVTSFAGAEIKFDEWDIDYAYSAPQKCLAGPPGVSLVALSERGMSVVRGRKRPPTSWCFDLGLIADYWGPEHKHHHTSPIPLIFGVREALAMALEEGIPQRIERHARVAEAFRAGITALGLRLPIPPDSRLNQLTVIGVPAGIDDQKVRQQLLDKHGIEIGRGLGQFQGKVWRVGLMGESSQPANVLSLLSALERVLPQFGHEVATGAGVTAASRVFAEKPVQVP